MINFEVMGCRPSNEKSIDSGAFKDLLRSMLHNTPLKVGTLVGFTLRCESFAFKVEYCIIL